MLTVAHQRAAGKASADKRGAAQRYADRMEAAADELRGCVADAERMLADLRRELAECEAAGRLARDRVGGRPSSRKGIGRQDAG
jgi:hypothetical protein